MKIGRAILLALGVGSLMSCASAHRGDADASKIDPATVMRTTAGHAAMSTAAGGGGVLSVANCSGNYRSFRPGISAVSTDGPVMATIVDATPIPPAPHDNSWTVRFTTLGGQPLPNAKLVSVRPLLEDHGRQPGKVLAITASDAPATYKVVIDFGFRGGAWNVVFRFDVDGAPMEVVFLACVP